MLLKAVFWDMDGTLIDSEPYWHDSEMTIAAQHGGYWDLDLAWQGSGKPLPSIAQQMIQLGTRLTADEIGRGMIDYVTRHEAEHMPWLPGVEKVLRSLAEAGIPSVLVTTSPRQMAENLVDKAPRGTFVGYVCGDDQVAKKPSPEPYVMAGRIVHIAAEEMPWCIAIEDSMTGLRSAAASGATTLAQAAFIRNDTSDGPQFATLDGYQGLSAQRLDDFVRECIER